MIHPDTKLKFIDPQIGYGVFATAFIPVGTIVYISDALDIEISPDSDLLYDPCYQNIIKKYCVVEPDGKRVLSWDIARYVNHCCRYNTISTGYGFEIAVRNIEAGEQITDDYGIFNLEENINLICHFQDCRKQVRASDFDKYGPAWDKDIKFALTRLQDVSQPLLKFMDSETYESLMNYLKTGTDYRSVSLLKYCRQVESG